MRDTSKFFAQTDERAASGVALDYPAKPDLTDGVRP